MPVVPTSLPRSSAAHVYPLLDGMRGAAALLIVLFHTTPYWGGQWFARSYLAVDLFFVLSGLVIERAYAMRLASGLSVGGFLRIRWIRLYPLYALAALLAAFSMLGSVLSGRNPLHWDVPDWLLHSLCAVLMLPVPENGGALYPMNGPAWSLAFEWLANLFYVLLFPLLGRRVLLLLVGLAALGVWATVAHSGHLDVGYAWADRWGGVARVSYSFFAGVWLAKTLGPTRSVSAFGSSISLLCALCAIALLCAQPPAVWIGAYDLTAVLLGFPLLVAGAVSWPVQLPLVQRTSLALGALSYALYVTHVPLSTLCSQMLRMAHVDFAAWAPLSGVLLLLFLVAVSVGLHRYFDQPVRAWLARVLN